MAYLSSVLMKSIYSFSQKYNTENTIKILLDNGANVHLKTNTLHTAKSIASSYLGNDSDLYKILCTIIR